MSIKIDYRCIEFEERPENPDHSRFYASWDRETGQQFKGCPLGRGYSEASARMDLVIRTEEENNLAIQLYGG